MRERRDAEGMSDFLIGEQGGICALYTSNREEWLLQPRIFSKTQEAREMTLLFFQEHRAQVKFNPVNTQEDCCVHSM